MLQLEEEYIQKICEDIIALKPDLVFTEKGVSGMCQSVVLIMVIVSQSMTFVVKIIITVSCNHSLSHNYNNKMFCFHINYQET